MSQFLCPSLQTKNFLVNNKDMSSSHPIFWSQRKPLSDIRSSELFSWSYPPKTNICAKVLAQISSKLSNFNSNLTNGTFINPLKVGNTPLIDEMLSTQVIRRLAPNLESSGISINNINGNLDMSGALSDTVFDSSSMAGRTAYSFDDKFCDNFSNVCSEDISVDSDSSNERTNKIQINDSKVMDSMQNDRQKKKKRKRRRRKKKSCSTPSEESSKKCFLSECRNEFISILFDNESNYDINEELTDTDLSSEELSICFEIGSELEQMCENIFVDYFFGNSSHTNSDNKQKTNSGSDEIDFCSNFCAEIPQSFESKSDEEDSEATAMNAYIRYANDIWNQSYSGVSEETRKPVKVNFSSAKPSVRVLHVWDYASRRARCGEWEELARDRQRFAEKCRRIESEISYIFNEEHRLKAYNSRYKTENI